MAGYPRHPPLVPPLSPPSYIEERSDLETSSIRSADSAAPSYASDRPPPYLHGERERALPGPGPAALGYEASSGPDAPDSTTAGDRSALERRSPVPSRAQGSWPRRRDEEQSGWRASQDSYTSRQYRNVVLRRQSAPGYVGGQHAAAALMAYGGEAVPFRPREDVALVGEVAARQAREQRLYRESREGATDALQQESVGWEFLLSQMADWEGRQRGCTRCRLEAARSSGRFGGRMLGGWMRFVAPRDGV